MVSLSQDEIERVHSHYLHRRGPQEKASFSSPKESRTEIDNRIVFCLRSEAMEAAIDRLRLPGCLFRAASSPILTIGPHRRPLLILAPSESFVELHERGALESRDARLGHRCSNGRAYNLRQSVFYPQTQSLELWSQEFFPECDPCQVFAPM